MFIVVCAGNESSSGIGSGDDSGDGIIGYRLCILSLLIKMTFYSGFWMVD